MRRLASMVAATSLVVLSAGCSQEASHERDFRTIADLGAAVKAAGFPCTNPRGGPEKVTLNLYYCGPSEDFTKMLLVVYPDHAALTSELSRLHGQTGALYGSHWAVFGDRSTLTGLRDRIGGTLQ